MPSGKGTGFEGDQRQFLLDLVPEYLAKTAYGKPATPGKPLPKDDPDLSTWVADRRREFETKFAEELTGGSGEESNVKPPKKIREVCWISFRLSATLSSYLQCHPELRHIFSECQKQSQVQMGESCCHRRQGPYLKGLDCHSKC